MANHTIAQSDLAAHEIPLTAGTVDVTAYQFTSLTPLTP